MATLDKLEIDVSRRVQLDRFEPVEYGAVGLFTLESDDDPADVFQHGTAALEDMVERRLAHRIASHKYHETGPSVPKVKAVLRDFTDTLDEEAITEIAEAIVAERESDE
jgi:inorganic pyrophosphatase